MRGQPDLILFLMGQHFIMIYCTLITYNILESTTNKLQIEVQITARYHVLALMILYCNFKCIRCLLGKM